MPDVPANDGIVGRWLDRGRPQGGTSGFLLSRNGFLVKVIRAAARAARTGCPNRHAAHLQAGVQVAPSWHRHAEPHLQLGSHAHDFAPSLAVAPGAAFAESTLLVDGII